MIFCKIMVVCNSVPRLTAPASLAKGPPLRDASIHSRGTLSFFANKENVAPHSTVTDLAKFRGLSTSVPRAQAV